MKSKLTYRRGWTRHRVASLPDPVTVKALVQEIGINERTVRRWLDDDRFRNAGVGHLDGTRWVFDKQKLWLWLLVIGAVRSYPERGDPSPEDAADELLVELKKNWRHERKKK